MQELHASLRIELVEDQVQAADMLAKFTALWAEMLGKLELMGVEANLTINETRRQTKRERTTRRLTAADFKAQADLKELKQVS